MDIILWDNPNFKALKVINGIKFTNRQIDIIACVQAGRNPKTIAPLLSICNREIDKKTVDRHIGNIMLKIGCNFREKIIDFVEKSDKFNLLKKYYATILTRYAFEQKLKNCHISKKK